MSRDELEVHIGVGIWRAAHPRPDDTRPPYRDQCRLWARAVVAYLETLGIEFSQRPSGEYQPQRE